MLPDNPFNRARLRLSLPSPTNDPLHADRLAVLNEAHIGASYDAVVMARYTDKQTRAAFTYARIAVADDRELQRLLNGSVRDYMHSGISVSNELRALRLIRQSASLAMTLFSTTILQDDGLLLHVDGRSATLTKVQRMAVVLRRGEKRVLQHILDLVDTVLPLFSYTWKDLQPIIQKLSIYWTPTPRDRRAVAMADIGLRDTRFDDYIDLVVATLMRDQAAPQTPRRHRTPAPSASAVTVTSVSDHAASRLPVLPTASNYPARSLRDPVVADSATFDLAASASSQEPDESTTQTKAKSFSAAAASGSSGDFTIDRDAHDDN